MPPVCTELRELRGSCLFPVAWEACPELSPKQPELPVWWEWLPRLIQKATRKRYEQGWVDEIFEDLDLLMDRIRKAKITARRFHWPIPEI
jgi:hypothetical protein